MIGALAVGFIVFLIIAGVMSSRSTKTKKRAVASLEQELEAVTSVSILDLVEGEVAELGLTEIEGAAELSHGALLKAWRDGEDVVASCSDRSRLRFVLAKGVDAANATEKDVTLECK